MPLLELQPERTVLRHGALRRRADLVIVPQWHGGRRYWVVKDPVAMRYFHLADEEHALFTMFDGQATLTQVQKRFERAFAPRQLTPVQLEAFVGRLHRDGLIKADVHGQGAELFARGQKRRWQARWSAAVNLLAIRFRGVDPEPLLAGLYPRLRWLFSWPVAVACLSLIAAALVLVGVQLPSLVARWPQWQALLTPQNLVWLLATLAAIKVLHELGHALACKHFGGECHEIGLMLLVFAPSLYCNVSDAWLIPSKWSRMAIAAAGIAVELVLAALATILWWFTTPGLVNMLAINTMLVCSLGTLFINGNPLLRYDGYYLLADWLETPNLWQRSRAVVWGALARWCLGWEADEIETVPRRRRALLAGYALASMAYRLALLGTILWLVYRALAEQRLAVVATLLCGIVFAGVVFMPLSELARRLRDPLRRRQTDRRRLAATGRILALLAAAALFIPLPAKVRAPAVLQPAGAERVYVTSPGLLLDAVRDAQTVSAGQTLAVLVNEDVELELTRLRGERDQQRLHLAHLEARRAADHEVAAQLPGAQAGLADLERRLTQRERDAARLRLVAPAAGVVLPPPPPPSERANSAAAALPKWRGSPLDVANRGCFLETGTVLCLVGDPNRLEAMLSIDQRDVELVASGQRVAILLDAAPLVVLHGAMVEVAELDLERPTGRTGSARDEPTKRKAWQTSATDARRSADEILYQARIKLDPHEVPLVVGARGQAKIEVAPQSLSTRLTRWLNGAFRW